MGRGEEELLSPSMSLRVLSFISCLPPITYATTLTTTAKSSSPSTTACGPEATAGRHLSPEQWTGVPPQPSAHLLRLPLPSLLLIDKNPTTICRCSPRPSLLSFFCINVFMDATTATEPSPTSAPSNQPTILSRLERLDVMMSYLEEIWDSKLRSSSCADDVDGGDHQSVDDSSSSPMKDLEKSCRPLDDVIMETKIKGSLINRLQLLEENVLELSLQTEEGIEVERKNEEERSPRPGVKRSPRGKKKGLKTLVKSCVKGDSLPKD